MGFIGSEIIMAKKCSLNVFQKHQLAIAKKTLKMTEEMANVMGGMTKAEAKIIKARLERKRKNKCSRR